MQRDRIGGVVKQVVENALELEGIALNTEGFLKRTLSQVTFCLSISMIASLLISKRFLKTSVRFTICSLPT